MVEIRVKDTYKAAEMISSLRSQGMKVRAEFSGDEWIIYAEG